MAAPPPNASMGLLNLGGCGAFVPSAQPSWSSGGGFLVPGRSISVLPLRWGLARKRGRVLDSRSAGAVPTGEAGSGSSELRHIEKELTFSPTFTDYVKIMESVKLDRSKNLQGGDSDGRNSRRRFSGHGDRRVDGRSRDARSKSFERKRGPRMDRGSDRGGESKLAIVDESQKNVSGFVDKRARPSLVIDGVNQMDRGSDRGGKSKLAIVNESQKNVSGFVDKRAHDDSENRHFRQGGVEEYVQRRLVRGERSVDGRSKSFERKRSPRIDRWSDRGGESKLAIVNETQNNVYGFVDKRAHDDSENRHFSQGNVVGYAQRRLVCGERSVDGRIKSFERKRSPQMDRGTVRGGESKLAIFNETQKNVYGFVDKRAHDDSENSHFRQGGVEEHVQRRLVCGDKRGTGGNKQFAPHVKAKDSKGGMTVHQLARDKQVQSGARKDFKERKIGTFAVPWTSAPPSTSIFSSKTKSVMGKGLTSTSSMNEKKFKYHRDAKHSGYEVHADSNFQRNQQRVENLGTNFVSHRFGDGKKPTPSKQYGHVETIPRHNGHSNDSLKYDKPEIIHIKRRENVKTGGFGRRDAESTDFDDRAAFKTFEVFTDVRNRPRILRMEMEERIQKLACRLNATDVNAPEWKFSKIIHDAKIKFSDHSILRIVQTLGRFGNWKRVLQVVEWLQSHEGFKSYKSRYIYTTVLDVLGKAKRPFEALNVFYTMQNQLSSYPDMAAYHCIAVTLGQAGLMKELFDVIDCMRSPPRKKFKLDPVRNWDPRLEPDLIVYNAVLNGCVQQKQWEGAFWVLQQLKEKNIRPTNTTYGLVMEVMLVCGKYNLVYEFFNKVEKSSMPSALNYKVLINALWREGKIDEAVMAVKDMENRGIVGSASLYYDLARCLCSGGQCEEALLQVPKICKVANKPLVVTYTGLIQTCIDSGSMENAKYIFNEMCNYCSPNNVTCNIMLKSYFEHGMFEDAKQLLHSILNGRIRSKVDSNKNAVVDKFTFNTFMEACAEANRWDDFEYAFREMLSNGYHFDERKHLCMVLNAYRSGKEQLLDDVWHYLRHHSRVPPAPLIMERFCLQLIRGDTMAAISCINSFQESTIHSVSSMSWLNLLTRNTGHLKEENITKLVRELNNLVSSRSSSDCLYQNILSSCTAFLSGATVLERAPADR